MSLRYIILFLVNEVLTETICPATRENNVRYFDVRLSPLTVPSRRTHYICQQFKAPAEETYHAIAFEPLIGKGNLVHHMLLFGCENDMGLQDPHECAGEDGYCRSWLTQYTIGVNGQICTHEDTGVRFGKNSFQHFLLQIHWNNENLLSNLTDNSGMRIYYTTNLRKHDVGNVQIGQNDIEIPARSINTEIMGVSGKLEIYRHGRLVDVVAQDVEYNFELSPIHVPNRPVKVLPGDEIRLTCGFSSGLCNRVRNETTYFGKGSDGEMCYAFITYYPRVDGFDQCIQFSDYDVNCNGDGGSIPIQCPNDKNRFVIVEKSWLENISRACGEYKFFQDCRPDCFNVITDFRRTQMLKCRHIEILGPYLQDVMRESSEVLKKEGFYQTYFFTSSCISVKK